MTTEGSAAEQLSALFWSAEQRVAGDFTPADPLAFDYLAQQIGNWIFPGFTSRTSRAMYYPMVLSGLLAAERAALKYGIATNDQAIQATFERFERFWAMAVVHHFRGEIPAGERMRGVQGVEKTYGSANVKRLPIDYKLIERQLELAALGAYLTSLRHHSLVEDGGLRPTSLGRELGNVFWTDPSGNKFAGQYDDYVVEALDSTANHIPPRYGNLTLEGLGWRGRLGRIHERQDLQKRLLSGLFTESPDSTTRQLMGVIEKADQAGIRDPERILKSVVRNQYEVDANLRELCILAVRFAEVSGLLRVLFDDLYVLVRDRGFSVKVTEILSEWLPNTRLGRIRKTAMALLECPRISRIGGLSLHGPSFNQLLRVISDASPARIAEALLRHHKKVQIDRGHAGWLCWWPNDSSISVELTSYKSTRSTSKDWMHDFKIGAVRQLLIDLGVVGDR